jgi:hypothetical protein
MSTAVACLRRELFLKVKGVRIILAPFFTLGLAYKPQPLSLCSLGSPKPSLTDWVLLQAVQL